MNRRMFLRGLTLGAVSAPRLAEAQQAGKVWRIGYLSLTSAEGDKSWVTAFGQGLRELGYMEGKNIVVEQRHAARQPARLPDLAAELVRLKVDVLVVFGAYLAAKKVASTTPVVFIAAPDPVGDGLVVSLARPGGNITGLSDSHADLVPKRLELLKEVVPSASRVAVLFNPANPIAPPQLKTAEAASSALGMTVLPVEVKGAGPGAFEPAAAAIRKERPGALLVIAEPTVGAHQKRIAELAVKSRLPTIGTHRGWAQSGFLMSYGTDFHDLWRRAATYVDKILKGAKPADLPVQQPTRFELVINLKTAKALGLTIPPSVLLRADEVIE
jgi:ABC-type uncharacterized transport system substrate-binding protein